MNKCVCFFLILLLFAVSFSAGCVSTASDKATSTPVSTLTNTPTSVQTQTAAPTESIDIAKEQAVKSAISYLKYSSFSYEGLIEQLEYEKFTHEQAVYGAQQNF
jgi:outer membrane murein-binding lipoprotein Lpp